MVNERDNLSFIMQCKIMIMYDFVSKNCIVLLLIIGYYNALFGFFLNSLLTSQAYKKICSNEIFSKLVDNYYGYNMSLLIMVCGSIQFLFCFYLLFIHNLKYYQDNILGSVLCVFIVNIGMPVNYGIVCLYYLYSNAEGCSIVIYKTLNVDSFVITTYCIGIWIVMVRSPTMTSNTKLHLAFADGDNEQIHTDEMEIYRLS
ncbi:hypothetical protein A3Q56_05810 [Intoshia linei]|uniref:Uncharacterized protein n=1 Tax=Intoshia linei TaxID=1819745 RepID=A0A177AZ21_9BILA|nr:hypothetical protein A3Q56_05810 [Intoshia linei]